MEKSQLTLGRRPVAAASQLQSRRLHHVLVVDDDPEISGTATDVLMQHGYDVNVVEDGEAAWVKLQTNRYHLLITDNEMPKLSGIQLLHKLHSAGMALPTIMAAEKLQAHKILPRAGLEPAATLAKPYTTTQLLRTVKHILGEADRAPLPRVTTDRAFSS